MPSALALQLTIILLYSPCMAGRENVPHVAVRPWRYTSPGSASADDVFHPGKPAVAPPPSIPFA